MSDIQIFAVLRNFKSNCKYINFGKFWIQENDSDMKKNIFKNFNYPMIPWNDNYILGRWDYIGRGGSSDFLSRRCRTFWYPLFIRLKLFKTGNLIMPYGFAKNQDRKYSIEINGREFYGPWNIDNPYTFNEEHKDKFISFSDSIDGYLNFLNFPIIPYETKPKILKGIDTRCALAIHIYLKGSIEHHNQFFIFDRLIDCSIALESLFLFSESKKREFLCRRISTLLSKNDTEKEEIFMGVEKFYRIRNDIVHGSPINYEDHKYLDSNFSTYENYLRKSILAFLDLNLNDQSKRKVIKTLEMAAKDSNYKTELQRSLKLLQLAE